jgi:predicted ATPase/DNA-binding CsgD family transcriptional regulator
VSEARSLPFVGRGAELRDLGRRLEQAGSGSGATVFVAGEGGVGKTRLLQALGDDAGRRGWQVVIGRAYPVETGVPYALFSDAFVPLLRSLDTPTLAVLSRGGEADLVQLFPAFGGESGASRSAPRGDPSEVKARLLWNFAQFVGRLAARRPLLVVLENLQWADPSSLELLHFLGRHVRDHRVLVVCSYNETEREANAPLRSAETSLTSLGVASRIRLQPLTLEETEELLRRSAGVALEAESARDLAAVLFDRTRGNPFFVEEMVKSLVERGRLGGSSAGEWRTWQPGELELPPTIRDALVLRLSRLSAGARRVAELAAVIGTRARYDVLRAVSGMSAVELVDALDELRRAHVVTESGDDTDVAYDFTHPLLQQTLYGELGRARAKLLHTTVAEALERLYATQAALHADELAFHFARADAGEASPKAVRYLAAAGRSALARYATREAVSYLSAALEIADGTASSGLTSEETSVLVEDLARAKQRSGEYDATRALLARVRDETVRVGDDRRLAAIERRMGLASYWSGRHEEALAHYDAGLGAARSLGDDAMLARLLLAKGMCLQELGRPVEAQQEVQEALAHAERAGDQGILARAHRALMLLYTFTGPAELALAHGELAIEHAASSGQRGVAWSAHWAMATLAGFTGNAAEVARHTAASERLADELRSPVLRAWTTEVAIEYASAVGDWDTGLAVAGRAIPVARALGLRTLLPRLLVWTGLIHLGRGDLTTAKAYFDESWTMSGAGGGRAKVGNLDVHTVVPAHTGMAAYHLALGEWRRAIRIGELGVEIADRSGYIVWAIHRLLPIVIEASLWLQDFERAERHGARLRRDAAKLGHRLGLAWAAACEALVVRLRERDTARAIAMLRTAADELEAVPFVVDASRIRRNLAQLLEEAGDRDEAARELRRAHDVFARLGAERELEGTRAQLRSLGARLPAKAPASTGAGALTGREVEIARMVAGRKSNKEIGAALGISSRTVSTHLSNIFAKLGLTSRGELTDVVRESGSGLTHGAGP